MPRGIGVAIESRVGTLKGFFRRHMAIEHSDLKNEAGPDGVVGAVSYVDDQEYYPVPYPNRLTCKRSAFEEEKEYRLVINSLGMKRARKIKNDESLNTPNGEYMDIEPQDLIENVYVSPNSPPHLMDSIEGVMSKHTGFSGDSVKWSELHRDGQSY